MGRKAGPARAVKSRAKKEGGASPAKVFYRQYPPKHEHSRCKAGLSLPNA